MVYHIFDFIVGICRQTIFTQDKCGKFFSNYKKSIKPLLSIFTPRDTETKSFDKIQKF